jgi:hypothetical protein
MHLDQSTSASTRIRTEWVAPACACRGGTAAAADPSRRMSTHRTSRGHVVYYRCYCGRPGAALMRLGT